MEGAEGPAGRCCQPSELLANAYRQQQLTAEELLAQAETALEENRLDPARRLFEQAEQVDPASARARGGARSSTVCAPARRRGRTSAANCR
ncbi:MAG: hypothetical protein U0736_16255 [Gemmataceae bacterium]